MKTLVIYKGKYGATQQYAQWIGEQLDTTVLLSQDCQWEELEESDTLVIGTSVYIGVLVIKDWIKENLKFLLRKKIFLFIVSGTPLNEKEKLQSYVQSSIPEELRKKIQIYFFPGKLNYKKLSLFDKFLLRMGALLYRKAGAKKSILKDYDEVKKENISTLINDLTFFTRETSPAA